MKDPTSWERLRRVDPLIWDSLLAFAVLGASILGTTLGGNAPADPARGPIGRGSPGVEVYVLLVLGCAPLALRRRRPIAVLTLVGIAASALAMRADSVDLVLALVVASFSAAAHTDRERFQRQVVPIAVASAAVTSTFAYPRTNWVEVLVNSTFVVGLPMIFGRVGFNRRRRIAGERERASRDAVAAERARIARELHDVVAHAMGVMVVQAGAARSVVDHDTEAAKAALARIEETGRGGMTEMRRLIGILKQEDTSADLAPQPGLAQLEALLDSVRGAGVPVETVTYGVPSQVSPGVDLSAYRVVQEALTNVIKHAGPTSARVVMRWSDDALEIEVGDDGRGATTAPDPPGHDRTGHGLIGMRERVVLYGGSLETGPRPGGGFLVRALLPIDGTFSQ
jgi:signal transduction histidine kinase